ncbi:hypothetical protein [Pseudomonas mosselii]|uniref:hypothetical protein n=1 Tax=Pseudomonas mosselii TaxID=78327 RepID=UPI00300CB694
MFNYKDQIKYILAFLVMLAAFQINFFNTSSDQQFKTWRDGSEALVLGKILADVHDIETGHSNMGFIAKHEVIKSADILAAYPRVDNPKSTIIADLTDANWTHGLSNFANTFILPLAATNKLGYATNEVIDGQKFTDNEGIIRTITGVSLSGNYLTVTYSGPRMKQHGISPQIEIEEGRAYAYDPYPQQFGIQALAMSMAYKYLPFINSVSSLQLIMAAMMALVLTLLIRELEISLSPLFAIIFFACMVGSPWIVAISRNLYWASFLWFLPMLAAMRVYRYNPGSRERIITIALYGAAIFMKCLAGYEYISSIILMSLTIFMIEPFKAGSKTSTVQAMRTVIMMGAVGVAGFCLAVTIHSANRADTFADGITQTLGWDALKYSALGRFAGVADSGPIVPLSLILNEYVTEWKTPVLFWLSNTHTFITLLFLAFISIAAQLYTKNKNAKRDAALLFVTALAPLSWLILMQKHSAVHVHLNYVLWYFGFIPACVFVVARASSLLIRNMRSRGHFDRSKIV